MNFEGGYFPMVTGDSRQQIIPPARIHVKAGFVVYSPETGERSIIILDEGELTAIDTADGDRKVVFKMHPGDLVGVASLLEREPFHLTIEASKDSVVTLINEDCMESELKTLPVWLLAVIRALSRKTRKLKASLYAPATSNSLMSLSAYCSNLPAQTEIPLANIIHEFGWLTKVKDANIQEDIKSLARRRFVELGRKGETITVKVTDPFLLELFVDYQKSLEEFGSWAPFKLSILQKKLLVTLSTINNNMEMDGPSWLSFLAERVKDVSVAEWIRIQKMGWCTETAKGMFRVNPEKVNYFLTALRFETNIRGVL
ncbi:MAG: Crp/Fnr family transcriptional regulator [Fibrobacter sp.]|nr:Crp/Fnr family transcriptional regulator [Fibrobacter sp.]